MPDLVFNTGPVIALTAALGALDFLQELYGEILIPFEVVRELDAGGRKLPGTCRDQRLFRHSCPP